MDASDYKSLEPLAEALARCARGERSELLSYLECSETHVQIGETATVAHSYFLKRNGNGQTVIPELVVFLGEQIIDYSLPKEQINEANEEYQKKRSSSVLSRLHRTAQNKFTTQENSGEAGELLLFSFAERVFKLPQLLSKMSLKTSREMHYHGADGVYAEGREDGGLNLYWGEAKIHKSADSAIRTAFSSLEPFLQEQRNDAARRTDDLFLIKSNLDLGEQDLTERLKSFFKPHTDESRSIKFCGLALVGFNSKAYEDTDAISQSIAKEFEKHKNRINNAVANNSLEKFDIHVICLPFNSVEEFRNAFARALGLSDAA